MRSNQGYTLLEMTIVVLITSVLAATAVPKFQKLFAENAITSSANALAADIKHARSEALLRRTNIHFVQLVADTANPWGGGWKIEDQALNTVIFENRSLPESIRIVSVPLLGDVTLLGIPGLVADTGGAVVDLEFKVCDTKVTGEIGRSVFISRFGRVAVRRHASSADCT